MTPSALLDAASLDDARVSLTRCCGAARWVNGMLAKRPFGSDAALFDAAERVWATMAPADVLEALTHHPRIGADLDELRQRYGATAQWAAGEQAGAAAADESTLHALRDGNLRYQARFGHMFVVCATGKSAAEMLALLEARLPNGAAAELQVAAIEQAKITLIRLEKLR